MSHVVLGYVQGCEVCGVQAVVSDPNPGWVCAGCGGPDSPEPDPWGRVYEMVRGLFDSLQAVRHPEHEGAVLDTVAALDDGDPEPVQLGPGAG